MATGSAPPLFAQAEPDPGVRELWRDYPLREAPTGPEAAAEPSTAASLSADPPARPSSQADVSGSGDTLLLLIGALLLAGLTGLAGFRQADRRRMATVSYGPTVNLSSAAVGLSRRPGARSPSDPVKLEEPMSQVQEREQFPLDESPAGPGREARPSPRRRRSWLPVWLPVVLVAGAIVGLAVLSALYVSSRSPTVYGARVDILFAATSNTSSDVRDRILATQQELLRGRAVLLPVSRSSDLPLSQLQDQLTVEIGRDDLLQVTVADRSPNRARAIAQAVTERYLELGRALPAADERGRRLVVAQIRRLTRGGRRVGPVGRERVARLQDRLLELDLARSEEPKPQILTPAYVLDTPLSPQPLRALAVGLLVGLLLATATTVLMVRRLRLRE